MEPLNAQVASIHARLRVWILLLDSNVESSNITCLLKLQFSRADQEAEGFGGALAGSRSAIDSHGVPHGGRTSRQRSIVVASAGPPIIPVRTTVLM
jgi:hypothetical protein